MNRSYNWSAIGIAWSYQAFPKLLLSPPINTTIASSPWKHHQIKTQLLRPRSQRRPIQHDEWRGSEVGQRMRPKVLVVSSTRRGPKVVDRRPPAVVPLGQRRTAEPCSRSVGQPLLDDGCHTRILPVQVHARCTGLDDTARNGITRAAPAGMQNPHVYWLSCALGDTLRHETARRFAFTRWGSGDRGPYRPRKILLLASYCKLSRRSAPMVRESSGLSVVDSVVDRESHAWPQLADTGQIGFVDHANHRVAARCAGIGAEDDRETVGR